MPVDVGSAVGYLDLDISGFLSGLKSAQSEADKTVKNIATQTGSKLQGIGSSMSSAGKQMTKAVTTPIAGLGTAIIKTSSDFESQMSKVSAISGATGGDLDALKAKAREMGSKTKFSATEAGEAFEYMAMAGWKTGDMLDGVEGIMNLAAASGEDLGTTSDIVTDALTAFGMSADESGRFADILAAASSNANTNVSMLGESFKYVAPTAGALGYSAEDTATALGLMANAGIKASRGGTSLNSILTNLSKPTDDMKDAMDYLGISLQNSDGSMKSLGEVMQNLRSSFGKCKMPMGEFQKNLKEIETKYQSGEMTEKQYKKSLEDLTEKAYGAEGALKAKYAATLAGKEGMAGLLAIVNASDSDFQKLTNSIYDSEGASKKMADTMNDNLSGQITILKSKLQELALQFGDIILPYVKKFVEKLDNLITKLQELTPEQKEQIAKWALFAAAIGPVLLVVGKLVSGVGSIVTVLGNIPGALGKAKTGFGLLKNKIINVKEAIDLTKAGFPGMAKEASKFGAALGGITAPMVAIGVAIGLLIGAFVTLWQTNEDFRNKMKEIWNQIKETVSEFCDGIVERINALGFDFENITDVLKTIWEGFCDFLAPIFESAFQLIADTLKGVLDVLLGIFDVFIGIFTGNWEQAWTGVKEIFSAVWEWIKDFFSNIGELIHFEDICNWFKTTWENTWNAVKDFFSNTWQNIKTFFSDMGKKISKAFSDFVEDVVKFFKNLPYNIGKVIGTVLGLIIVWVPKMAKQAKETGKQFVSNIVTFFKELPGKVKQFITNTYNNVKTWGKNMANKAKTTSKEFLNNAVSFIKNLPQNTARLLKQVINKVKDWASDMGRKGREGAQNMFDSVINGLANLPDRVMDIGRNIVEGIWNGICGAAGWLQDQVNSFLNGIVDGMAGALGIHSPSTVMRDKIGKWMPMGIGEGFIKQLPDTMKDMKEQFDKNLDKFKGNLNTLKIKGIEIIGGDNISLDDFNGIKNSGFDYQTLAWYLLDVLRKAPINIPVSVEMQDGDVIIDKERVGRKVAPVVSRVIAQGT